MRRPVAAQRPRVSLLTWVLGALTLITCMPTQQGLVAGDPRSSKLTRSLLASGLQSPTAIAVSPDSTGRVFVTEQPGRVRLISRSGALAPTPYLDLTDRVLSGGERGLLGLAFDPGFATNGNLFAFFTDRRLSGDIRVARYHASPTAATASKSSELSILTIPHRTYANHNGGMLAFGPDKLLYIGVGDGGGAGDPLHSGQSYGTLLGKVLRIDVSHSTATKRYAIPATNPWPSTRGIKPEVFHAGLRNPWRFSFNRVTGTMWIGDVGQSQREEVDTAAKGVGGHDFGWSCREGTLTYNADQCRSRPYRAPRHSYSHAGGACSITGGYVYEGAAYASRLKGVYVYADYCTGSYYGLVRIDGRDVVTTLLDTDDNPTTFGEDRAGELLVADADGSVYRLKAAAR